MEQDLTVRMADLGFRFHTEDPLVILDGEGSIQSYCTKNASESIDYSIFFSSVAGIDLSGYQLAFTGEPTGNEFLNYNWYVYAKGSELAIFVHFIDHPEIKSVVAEFEKGETQVKINLVLQPDCPKPVLIDPLLHPLGSLLLLYLVHWKQGLLIHASAVEEGGEALLFTGVSGIGKSTMARLWESCGARVLNDDRLVIRVVEDQVKLYNNPMPHYKQAPREAILKKIFLLKQSADNYIQPLSGIQAYSRVLGNFIQQFYEPAIVKKHLGIVEEVIRKVSVYEVGFKPDTDIVRMIREMDKNERPFQK